MPVSRRLTGRSTAGSTTASAPDLEQDESGGHAAQMGEMGDTLLGARHAEDELEDAIQRDEQPRWHRDRREQQHEAPVGICHAEGEQQPEHSA